MQVLAPTLKSITCWIWEAFHLLTGVVPTTCTGSTFCKHKHRARI